MTIGITAVVVCFVVGGIPFGLLIARGFGIPDIREYGSGNIGASNVLRTVGAKAALLVWLADVAKGAGPTLAAAAILGDGGWWHAGAALATIVGHCYSPYLGFSGGRGVATTLGVMLALDWRVGLAGLVMWILLIFVCRIISISSVVAVLCCTPVYWLLNSEPEPAVVACTVMLGLLVTYRHSPNIVRLLNGTEPRIGQKAKELQQDSGDGHERS